MKRELKHKYRSTRIRKHEDIAKPIPMKRELKHLSMKAGMRGVRSNCKAYPDEKGIETRDRDLLWR